MTPEKTPGQALAVAHSDTDMAALDTLDEILLTGEVDAEIVDDPQAISRQMVAQLLNAPDDEALQQFGNAEPWGDYLNVPMELRGFRWRKSELEGEGAPIYVIVETVNMESGERKVLTVGAMSVLAQLSNMARRQTLVGGVWMLVEATKPTKSGYKPRWLQQPDKIREAAKVTAEPAAS